MHHGPSTALRRPLVADPGHFAPVDAMGSQALRRTERLASLARFAPLLAGAAVLSCFVLAWILFGRIEPTALIGWALLVIASNWLMVRRLETNALLHIRRDPPRLVRIESGVMPGLVALVWMALPVMTYRGQPDDVQTVLTGAICAMMCGALAVSEEPFAATAWAGTLAIGVGLALHIGGDRVSLPMTLLVIFHCGFIFSVVRRKSTLLAAQAGRDARQQAELASSTQLIREYEERGISCLWQTDADHRIIHATPGLSALTGTPASRIAGASLLALLEDNGGLRCLMLARAAIAGIEMELGEGTACRSIGIAGTPIIDSAGAFLGYRGSCTDVTAARRSERQVREMADIDMLTGLPNRIRMRALLADTLRGAGPGGRSCALLLLDLDRFKPVNDAFGHPGGDAVLKAVAGRLWPR